MSIAPSLRTCLRQQRAPKAQCICQFTSSRSYSEAPIRAPPLLLKLRGDLKTAMKAKDANRLTVLRSILADITNASKTQSPIKTDMQVLSLLRKKSEQGKAAAAEFASAGRADLKEKEEGEISVLEEYAGSVRTMDEGEVRTVVDQTIKVVEQEGGKVDRGTVLRRLVGPEGSLAEANVDKKVVARVVQEVLGAGKS